MRRGFEGTAGALRSPFPWIAYSAALALTVAGWLALERSRDDEARVQFERRTETAVAAVRARMRAYEQVLRSAAAHIASTPGIAPADFRAFVGYLQVAERFPGVRALGYAVHSRGADGAERATVAFVEPDGSADAPAVGADLYARPALRAAMQAARRSGEAAISAAEDASFVMFVPVFHGKTAELPRAERERVAAGEVFSRLRPGDLMHGILDDGVLRVLDMRIYDEAGGGAQAVLMDTRGAGAPAGAARFERIVHLPMPGRAWTVHFIARPDFDLPMRASHPWAELGLGALASTILFLMVVALVAAWNQARDLSMRDPLTGLFNRRYLEETMPRELPRARRHGHSIGIVVIDLDHFKRLNDTHGHDAGDHVLARFGELLRVMTRGSDIACRFGGEEFGVILPGANLEAARARAEAIRAAFEELQLDCDGVRLGVLTLSAGVASLPPTRQDWAHALRKADRALYAAKHTGRNRVVSE